MSSDATVIQGPWEARVVHLNPTRPFGRKPPGLSYLSGSLPDFRDALRPEDRAEVDRVKRAAREARNALDGRHVDPSLKAELAAKVGVIAELCERAAHEAKLLGELRAAVTLREHQGLLETLSAELVP